MLSVNEYWRACSPPQTNANIKIGVEQVLPKLSTCPRPANRAAAAKIILPRPGVIRVEHDRIFKDPDSRLCRRFLQIAMLLPVIKGAVLAPSPTPAVELHFDSKRHGHRAVLFKLIKLLREAARDDRPNALIVTPSIAARDLKGTVRYQRLGTRVTGWSLEREQLGSIRLSNPVLYRKRLLCDAIERELLSIVGVHRYDTCSLNCRVEVEYDPRQISRAQLISILDEKLLSTKHPRHPDKIDRELMVCTTALPIAAAAQCVAPALMPASAALLIYTSLPNFRGAWDVVTKERRLGVDVLDSMVIIACLGTGQVLAGGILCWCLSFGRHLVRRTEDSSKRLLLGAFGKQPRSVWLLQDGQEIETSVASLRKGDVVVVRTGEVVPVDGVIVDGLAMIDQHALTGESTPAERNIGDQVFASTVMVSGEMRVRVEKSGDETATSKIAQIMRDTAGYKLASQHKGERLADKAVVPTLAAGGLALSVIGANGAAAVLNSDMGTGIRMAAPLAMLSTLALCAQRGVLVKDGRALDLLCEVDAVLFDKTGTLTRERPEVGRIIAVNGYGPRQILAFAAAAEQRFEHPIALAILQKAKEEEIDLLEIRATEYKVGFGITVTVDGSLIHVGSQRFLEREGIPLIPEITTALEETHRDGQTMVMVAVDGQLRGALELRASLRPETPALIKGLRARGVKHIAIISGDHESPTRRLAQRLGIDRYFAEVLPADKAEYVEKLQREGRKVCFIGDGVNDAIALKKANVSISLRGATSIATDAAHIVFMEPGLGKLCELFDIARDLERNVQTSWTLILAPNILCIIGAFTLGFGIPVSVLTNNVAALGALANGVRPMRKVAALEATRRRAMEMQLRDRGRSHPV
jgi:heavy metal translocating P-type ATPase